ncbi:MAG: sensor histidine kinase [Clostridia bacterium]|nr:sensor histidine kinase [Clostridia bacterium]
MKVRGAFINRINDIALNYKFLLIYLLCVLVPIITINLIFLDNLSNTAREREEENLRISMDRARSDIIALIDGCVYASYSISTDRIVYEALDRRYADESEFYEVYDRILREKFAKFIPIYSQIGNLRIYANNPTILNGGCYFNIDDSVRSSQWYKDAMMNQNKIILNTYQEAWENSVNTYVQHISVLKKLNDYPTENSTDMIVKIDINLTPLYWIFNRESSYLELFLLDSEGRIACATNRSLENGLFKDIELKRRSDKQEKEMLFDRALGNAEYIKGWRLVGIADKTSIVRAMNRARSYVVFLAIISTVISSFLVIIMLRSYNYRIKKLLKHMEKAKNQQFDLISMTEGKDEIGGLIRSFNRMASKINTLINNVYKLEIQKKDLELERVRAELNFLQSQMNPHFLFNTLNALLVTSVKNGYTEITEVIKYLSKTLRRLLSWKDDLVTVEEELTFTEMYLKIEKFRFGEKFDYVINMDREVSQQIIPKMTIQPLVENACKHGIQTIKGIGRIQVQVCLEAKHVVVRVEDNGIGITEERVNGILADISKPEKTAESIGLRNIYRRLKLYYGDKISFDIKSAENQGTSIWIRIPLASDQSENEELLV